MAQTFRVAGVQMRSGTEPEANLDAIEARVAEAAARGARYVLTPEVCVAFAENREGYARVARPFEGNPAVARAGEIARQHGVHLHLGSMAVALPDGRFANRSVLFGPDGGVVATYDKIHLFDATLPGLQAYRESHTYRGGEKATLSRAPGFGLGFTICYDVRFPALFNALAKAGAEVIAVPAAFTVPTGQAHWEILLRARAIETGTFVVAAAQGGQHQNGRRTYGHSMIVDPWGTILAKADGDEPGVIVADIDLDRIAEARAQVPALENERAFSLARLG
jgi:predicted amidohydrolase